MANIGKFRAHESLNVDTAAKWDVNARLDISSQAEVTVDVSNYHQIGLYSELAFFIRFDGDSGTSSIVVLNPTDLVVPKETLTFIKIPKGVGNTVYLHVKATSSTSSKFCRLVKL